MNKKLLLAFVIGLIVAFFVGFFVLGKDATAPETTTSEQHASTQEQASQGNGSKLTTAEVAKHNNENDCWTIIAGAVYDITPYINRHPGGDEILRACGTNATDLFEQRRTSTGESVGSGTPHSEDAQNTLKQFKLGDLQQ